MAAAIKAPGVKVNRTKFLQSCLTQVCTPQQAQLAIATTPLNVLTDKQIDQLARKCISRHTMQVTAVSTATGLPGGWALAATIPADMLQYFFHVFKVSQKLAYLYGFPDLCDEQGNLTREATDALTVFTGVMMGVNVALNAFKELCERAAVQAIRRLPEMSIARNLIYPLARSIGMQLTRERASRAITRAVPLVGGVVSGTLTYTAFRPSARRLQRQLRAEMVPRLTSGRTTPPPLPPVM